MSTDSTQVQASKFQKELDNAIKRYTKTVNLVGSPPEISVGPTPRKVIWSRNKARVYRYLGNEKPRFKEPILLVYSLINRSFILDLRPGSSLVEFLLNQGYDVYLMDWGVPGPEDADLKLDDLVLDYMPQAVQAVQKTSGSQELSVLGYCLGGVLVLCYAAAFGKTPIKNLIGLAVPLDFSDKTLFNDWLDPKHFNVNLILDGYGNMPGEFLDFGTRLKDPVNGFWTSYTSIYDKVLDDKAVESWLSMQRWLNDLVPFPGAAFKQVVYEFWHNNKFVKSELVLRGNKINLSSIKMSFLNVMAERDTIVPGCQSNMALSLIGSSDKEEVIMPGGHVGLVMGRTAVKGLWPVLHNWLSSRSARKD